MSRAGVEREMAERSGREGPGWQHERGRRPTQADQVQDEKPQKCRKESGRRMKVERQESKEPRRLSPTEDRITNNTRSPLVMVSAFPSLQSKHAPHHGKCIPLR